MINQIQEGAVMGLQSQSALSKIWVDITSSLPTLLVFLKVIRKSHTALCGCTHPPHLCPGRLFVIADPMTCVWSLAAKLAMSTTSSPKPPCCTCGTAALWASALWPSGTGKPGCGGRYRTSPFSRSLGYARLSPGEYPRSLHSHHTHTSVWFTCCPARYTSPLISTLRK